MTSTPQLEVVVQAYEAETGSVQEVVEKLIRMETAQDEDLSRMNGHSTTGRLQFSVAVSTPAQWPGNSKQQSNRNNNHMLTRFTG